MAVAFFCCGIRVEAVTVTIFDNIPETGQTNYNTSYTSIGYQATQTTELGNAIDLAGTARQLETVRVKMVTYAKNDAAWSVWKSNNPTLFNSSGYNHDLTLRIYQMTSSNTIQLLTSRTTNLFVPWAQPSGINSITLTPNTGQAFDVSFDFSSENRVLSNRVVVSIGFDTQSYGDSPTGQAGPYNSLNFGVLPTSMITVGSDVNPNDFFWIRGSDPTPYFASAPDYSGYAPMMEIKATEAPQTPYDVWIASYGYTVGVSPALRSEDPDGDGMSNLTEFAFGTDPTFNTASPIQVSLVNSSEVRVTFLQRTDNSVSYDPKSSTDLLLNFSSWSPFTPSLSSDQTGMPRPHYSRFEVLLDSATYERTFVRVEALENP